MVKGLDVGYEDTKDNEGRIFKSAYSYYDKTVLGARRLTIDGRDHYVGRGIQTSDNDKTNSELNKVCTINNLSLSNACDFKLCVGLPVAQYKSQKQKLKESIFGYNKCSVFVNGVPFRFKITDVYVVMQGVASLYSLDAGLTGDFIVIDIGGLTIDISLVSLGNYESVLQIYDTWYKGTRTLHSSIMEKINNIFGLQLGNEYADKILRNGYIEIDGKKESVDFLKPFLQDYVNEVIADIKLKYPTRIAKIVLVGGGSILMHSAFKKHFPNCTLIPNAQFSNAKGYYAIACSKFK